MICGTESTLIITSLLRLVLLHQSFIIPSGSLLVCFLLVLSFYSKIAQKLWPLLDIHGYHRMIPNDVFYSTKWTEWNDLLEDFELLSALVCNQIQNYWQPHLPQLYFVLIGRILNQHAKLERVITVPCYHVDVSIFFGSRQYLSTALQLLEEVLY